MEQDPFPEKSGETSPGTLAGTRKETENHDGTKPVSWKNWEPHSAPDLFGEKSYWNRLLFEGDKKRDKKGDKPRNQSRNQQKQEIMMEQPPFLSKERKDKKGDKKGDKPWNQSRNQQEAGNHDGTDSFFEQRKKKQEGR